MQQTKYHKHKTLASRTRVQIYSHSNFKEDCFPLHSSKLQVSLVNSYVRQEREAVAVVALPLCEALVLGMEVHGTSHSPIALSLMMSLLQPPTKIDNCMLFHTATINIVCACSHDFITTLYIVVVCPFIHTPWAFIQLKGTCI